MIPTSAPAWPTLAGGEGDDGDWLTFFFTLLARRAARAARALQRVQGWAASERHRMLAGSCLHTLPAHMIACAYDCLRTP